MSKIKELTSKEHMPRVEVVLPDDDNFIVGAGCFPADAYITTPEGDIRIADLSVGDLVYCYDENNYIHKREITEVHKHHYKDTDNLIIKIDHDYGTIKLTPNHWVFVGNNEYKEAGQLNIGDVIYCLDNVPSQIKSIKKDGVEPYVYNLTINEFHNFIADGIRVHNGGGGKGGGGGGGGAKEDPNTLKSRQVVRVMELISEGVIENVHDVLFDDNPISNVARAEATWVAGNSSQDWVPGFADTETVHPVNIEITFATPYASAVSQTGIDSVAVEVGVDSLFTTDTSTGDIHGGNVVFQFDMRYNNTYAWQNVLTFNLGGKTMSQYSFSVFFYPGEWSDQLWEFRIRRATPDSTSSAVQNKTRVFAYSEIVESKLTYPNSAYVALKVDAEATGGQIPVRSYDVSGVKVKIPSNYNPTTKVYTGTWDGTWNATKYWTDNPVWCLYDLITNERYGMGIPEGYIDKFSFYYAAQYCDETVDGEPRFTFNAQIMLRDDGFKVVQAIASAARCYVSYVGGIITLLQDRPKTTSALITNSDVVDGLFEYTSSALQTRTTVCNVTFNDPADRYLAKITTEEDTAGIDKYGYNVADVIAYGCTSEKRAKRLAKWKLESDNVSSDIVAFKLGLNRLFVKPGDLVEIFDEEYATRRLHGKIKTATTTQIVLDAPVAIPTGTNYVKYYGADGTTLYKTQILQSNTTTDTLTTSGSFTSPLVGSSCVVLGAVNPRPFVIDSISFNPDDNIFSVAGIFYDETKFARIEQGITIPPPIFTDPGFYTQDPPSNIQVVPEQYNDGQGIRRMRLRVSWDEPTQTSGVEYQLKWSRNSNPYITESNILVPYFVIDNADYGQYEFILYAFNPRGVKSLPAYGSYSFLPSGSSNLYPVTNLRVINGVDNDEFNTPDCTIAWDENPNNDGLNGTLDSYVVEVWDLTGTTKQFSKIIPKTETQFVYLFGQNVSDFGTPTRSFKFKVYARDSLGKLSTATQLNVSNAPPAAPSLIVTSGYDSVFVEVIFTTIEPDMVGVKIAMGDVIGFTPTDGNIVFRGDVSQVNIFDLVAGETKYFKAAGYDSFTEDVDNLTWSTGYGGSAKSVSDDVEIQEYRYENLNFKANDPSTNSVSWTAGTGIDLTDGSTWSINSGSAAWTSGVLYLYNVAESNTILATTNLVTATGGTILASYRGGTNLQFGDSGGAYIDGGKVLAQTIGANQLVANSAIITNELQVGSAVINEAAVKTAAITNAKIGDLAVSTGKIQNAAITNAKIANLAVSSAQIQDAAITSAKIGTAEVGTIKLANGAITDVYSWNVNANISDGYYSDTFVELAWAEFTKGQYDSYLLINAYWFPGQIVTTPTFNTASTAYYYCKIDVLNTTTSGVLASSEIQSVLAQWYGSYTAVASSHNHWYGAPNYFSTPGMLTFGIDTSALAVGTVLRCRCWGQKNRTNTSITTTHSGATFFGNMTWWTR